MLSLQDRLIVFDDEAYEKDVLHIEEGCHERDVDSALTEQAQVYGIEDQRIPTVDTPERLRQRSSGNSSVTCSEVTPRSTSLSSYRSCSTGLTSIPSRTSRDKDFFRNFSLNFKSISRPASQHNKHPRHLDLSPSHITEPVPRHLFPAASTTSLKPALHTSKSTRSLSPPLASPKAFSIRRSLGRISRFRKSSTPTVDGKLFACHSCPDNCPPKELVRRLVCHHSLCNTHLRQKVVTSFDSGFWTPPQCCGHSIAIDLIQSVTTEQEQDRLFGLFTQALAHKGVVIHSPTTPPLSTRGSISFQRPHTAAPTVSHFSTVSDSSRTPRHQSSRTSVATERHNSVQARKNLDRALNSPEFRAFRISQEKERDRFVAFRTRHFMKMNLAHEALRKDTASLQRRAVQKLQDSHPCTLSQLEDRHVAAELDLHHIHEQEKRNMLIRLRHMEAYYNNSSLDTDELEFSSMYDVDGMTTNESLSSSATLAPIERLEVSTLPKLDLPSGSDNTLEARNRLHIMTETDRRELEKQHWLRDNLDRRQAAAINVLREQQARAIRARQQKNETELAVLRQKHRRDLAHIDETCRHEREELDEVFDERRARIEARWALQFEIWRRQQEIDRDAAQAASGKKSNKSDPIPDLPIMPVEWPLLNHCIRAS